MMKHQHVLCWYLESIKSQKHVGLMERRGNESGSDKSYVVNVLMSFYAMTTSFVLTILNLLLHDIYTLGTGFKEDKRNLMGLWDQASHSGRC